MKITKQLLSDIFAITSIEDFEVSNLGLSNSDKPNTLSFLDDTRFLQQVNANANISVVIATPELKDLISGEKIVIEDECPRFSFYTALNHIGKLTYIQTKSVIDPSAQIHTSASVSEFNVKIGPNTIIEPNVTILPDVEIGQNCIIRAGSVIGAEGFEQKRTPKGILAVLHFGKVIIHDDVHIGALNGIAKGMSFRDTIIGESTRTDNLVHIAHGVQIGKRCLFPAACMIAGSVTINDDVWVGPNASISSGVTLRNNAFVTIGSVVTREVMEGDTVTGNFAIPHKKFLRNLKNSLND